MMTDMTIASFNLAEHSPSTAYDSVSLSLRQSRRNWTIAGHYGIPALAFVAIDASYFQSTTAIDALFCLGLAVGFCHHARLGNKRDREVLNQTASIVVSKKRRSTIAITETEQLFFKASAQVTSAADVITPYLKKMRSAAILYAGAAVLTPVAGAAYSLSKWTAVASENLSSHSTSLFVLTLAAVALAGGSKYIERRAHSALARILEAHPAP